MLLLISVSISIDYIVGYQLYRANISDDPILKKTKKAWMTTSILSNLTILGFFKYYNFFADSFAKVATSIGFIATPPHLNIFLPIGISYYTFKTLSYTIDIYYNKMPATRKLADYALYVSFFPELLAGPIDRARNLLPQIFKKNQFNRSQFLDGVNLLFIGLFKKLYVADNLSNISDKIYSLTKPSIGEVIIGAYIYSFQIYCDFSGYTDIARGLGKCLGFELAINFKYPYLSTSPSEFWQRWHITLSTWLRDYIFMPLGGALHSMSKAYRNLAITMILAGLWHGASWTFVIWGAYQGALLIGHRMLQPILKKNGAGMRKIFSRKARKTFKIVVTFQLVSLGWLIFNANSFKQICNLFSAINRWQTINLTLITPFLLFVLPLIILEAAQYAFSREEIFRLPQIPVLVKTIIVAVIFYLIVLHGTNTSSFIYAQF